MLFSAAAIRPVASGFRAWLDHCRSLVTDLLVRNQNERGGIGFVRQHICLKLWYDAHRFAPPHIPCFGGRLPARG